MKQFRKILFALFFVVLAPFSFADHGEDKEEEGFDIGEMMIHHVVDNHDWHIFDIPKSDKEYIPVAVHLPWFFYDSEEGFQFFASTEALVESGKYTVSHEHVYKFGKEVKDPKMEEAEHYLYKEGGNEVTVHEQVSVLDLSITKTVLQMMIIALLMIFVFTRVAKGYKKREGMAPKGVQSFFEPIIIFVRDEIAKPNLHKKTDKYLPYLLNLFFFIWFANMFGLTPLNVNITGNISVTAALSALTLLIILVSSNKHYWQHIFWFPNVPVPVKFIMLPVELLGIFVKPFALMVRLFANISAGHFMMLALIGLMFLLGKGGESMGGAIGIAPVSVLFTLFIMTLEILVAAIQAYVFTVLSAIFIGMAFQEAH